MKMDAVINMAVIDDFALAIKDMQEDATVPKNVKTKLMEIEKMLESKDDQSIKFNKVLDMLVEVSDDVNLQPYVRTRIWNLVTMLEAK